MLSIILSQLLLIISTFIVFVLTILYFPNFPFSFVNTFSSFLCYLNFFLVSVIIVMAFTISHVCFCVFIGIFQFFGYLVPVPFLYSEAIYLFHISSHFILFSTIFLVLSLLLHCIYCTFGFVYGYFSYV